MKRVASTPTVQRGAGTYGGEASVSCSKGYDMAKSRRVSRPTCSHCQQRVPRLIHRLIN